MYFVETGRTVIRQEGLKFTAANDKIRIVTDSTGVNTLLFFAEGDLLD